MRNLRKAIELILNAHSICIACHESPNGDAIGSLTALGRGLSQLSKEVYLLSPDGMPAHLSFLGEGLEIKNIPPRGKVDLLILVDAESPQRLGGTEEIIREKTLIIDHHPPSTRGSRGVNLIDKKASATAEILYKLLRKLGVKFTTAIIEALLSAILSDTGGLRFPNTTPKTLNIVARLMRAGGDLEKIYRRLYEERSEGYLKILGEVLLRARINCGGKVITSYILDEDREKYDVEEGELEGIVNYLRLLRDWQVVFLLKERRDGIRVNIRSRSLDAGKFAQLFGGGGHKEAAGCTIHLSLEETQNILMEELKKWMVC